MFGWKAIETVFPGIFEWFDKYDTTTVYFLSTGCLLVLVRFCRLIMMKEI